MAPPLITHPLNYSKPSSTTARMLQRRRPQWGLHGLRSIDQTLGTWGGSTHQKDPGYSGATWEPSWNPYGIIWHQEWRQTWICCSKNIFELQRDTWMLCEKTSGFEIHVADLQARLWEDARNAKAKSTRETVQTVSKEGCTTQEWLIMVHYTPIDSIPKMTRFQLFSWSKETAWSHSNR